MFMTKKVVSRLHSQNLKVLVWTPNAEKQIKRAIKLGADGIISDEVQLLKEVILKLDPQSQSFS